MRATIKMIAEKAGVSIGTVDRVLHDRPYVKPEVRERVLAVMEELDRILDEREEEYTVCIPYTEGKFVSLLRENAKIIEEEYTENGTRLRVRSASQYKSMVKEYLE